MKGCSWERLETSNEKFLEVGKFAEIFGGSCAKLRDRVAGEKDRFSEQVKFGSENSRNGAKFWSDSG